MSFGAFLDEGWRRNDMLWGRLDGAERLISALIPEKKDEKTRDQLIEEAHRLILEEESKTGGLIGPRADLDTPEKIWNYFKTDFQVNRKLPLQVEIQLASRGANVAGNMFVRLAEDHHSGLGKWIARVIAGLGKAFGKISEVWFRIAAVFRGIFS